MRDTAAEIRRLHGKIDLLEKRQERHLLKGTVKEVKDDKVRLVLQEKDEATGKEMLSPWIRWQGNNGSEAQGFSLSIRPAKGERMMLWSPSGDIGPASLAVPDSFSDDAPNPDAGKDMVLRRGDTRIEMTGDGIQILVGGVGVRVTADEVVTLGRTRLNNGTAKIHRVGDRDSAADLAETGADEVFA